MVWNFTCFFLVLINLNNYYWVVACWAVVITHTCIHLFRRKGRSIAYERTCWRSLSNCGQGLRQDMYDLIYLSLFVTYRLIELFYVLPDPFNRSPNRGFIFVLTDRRICLYYHEPDSFRTHLINNKTKRGDTEILTLIASCKPNEQ